LLRGLWPDANQQPTTNNQQLQSAPFSPPEAKPMSKYALLLCLLSTLATAQDGWRVPMHEVHEPSIDQAHARADWLLNNLNTDAYGREDLPQARALLDAPTRKADHEALVGNWRCRSTQIDPSGVFAYPAFRCSVELTEDGILMFTKTTGSQRRHGQIYPFSDSSWVFLGGRSVNDDPYRAYSGTLSDLDGERLQDDSIGLLETLRDGRIRIIFDASEQAVEFYELSR